MLHLIIQFLLYYVSNGRLREVKNRRNFKLSFLKVVAVAYERWSLTRGSKYSDLKVKNDPRSEFSNLSNWKEEA